MKSIVTTTHQLKGNIMEKIVKKSEINAMLNRKASEAVTQRLMKHPERVEKENFSAIRPEEAKHLLIVHPELCTYYNLDLISESDWLNMLLKQPKLLAYRDLKKFSLTDFEVRGYAILLLGTHWELRDELPGLKLNSQFWMDFLSSFPEQSAKCDCWENFSLGEWLELIMFIPPCRTMFVELLRQGKFDSELAHGNGYVWWRVLSVDPTRKFNCDTELWDEQDWARVIGAVPSLLKLAPSELQESPLVWSFIMQSHPEYQYQPTFQKLIEKFDDEDWERILYGAPHLATPERLKLLADSSLLAELLEQHPKLMFRGGAELLNGDDWLSLLELYPELTRFCNWNAVYALGAQQIDGGCPAVLLDKIDWTRCAKNSTQDWVCTLRHAPEMADQCDCLELFSLENWADLLIAQPQLASYLEC